MTTVITGAAGFIGSNLSKFLEDKGTELKLADNFLRGKQQYLDFLKVKTECPYLDLKLYPACKNLTKDADVVYHTACKIGGEQFLHGSPKIEFMAFYDNMLIDNNILRACIENNVKKIIFTSSASVHNTTKQNIELFAEFKENELDFDNHPYNAVDPEGGYGWTKFMTEYNMKYLRELGIKTGIARIWKSYGPCDDYSPESGQVVCSLMRKAINYPKEPFIVWGNGQKMRNLLYIDDLIDGLFKIEKYLDEHETITVNLGGEKPNRIFDIAKDIIKLSGKNITMQFDTTKSGGPRSRIGNLEYVKKELNWKPKVPLQEGLLRTWDWMKYEMGVHQ